MNFTKTIINAIKYWVNSKLNNYVEIVEGKGLSTEDYTTEEKEKVASVEAGAQKNTQPDWNQNDESADDYVKNRPFYTGGMVDSEIFATTISSWQNQGDMYVQQLTLDSEVVLTEGETYKVIWNGVEYETVAWNLEGTPGIGDKSLFDGSESTGEPFLIGLLDTMGIVYAFDLTADTDVRTVSINIQKQDIVKLPIQYLPDGYPYKENYVGEIVPETTVNIENTSNPALDPFAIEFTAGKTYTVAWNGVEYECVSYIAEGLNTPSIGNGEIADVAGGNGEPFFCTVFNGQIMLFASETGSHTISISSTTEKVVQMSSEYIPKFTINVDVTYDPHPNASAAYFCTMDKSVAEIAKAYLGGFEMRAVNKETGEYYILETAKQDRFGDWDFDFVNWNIDGDIHFNRLHMWTPSSGDAVALYTKTQANSIYEQTADDDRLASAKAVYNFVNSKCYISYNDQELTEDQQAQARANIGAEGNEPKDNINLVDQINGYTYIVCMRNGNLVTYCQVEKIEVTTMPTTTEYMAGGVFDPEGMVVTAVAYDGTTREIANYTYPTERLTEDMTSIEITYTMDGANCSVTVPITVNPFDAETILVDFEYTDNGDGTYTITGWKGTYNGEASTEMIIPDYACIIV